VGQAACTGVRDDEGVFDGWPPDPQEAPTLDWARWSRSRTVGS